MTKEIDDKTTEYLFEKFLEFIGSRIETKKTQHGHWFRWSRANDRNDYFVSLTGKKNIARFKTEEEAIEAVEELESLVNDYISESNGTKCKPKS